MRGWINGLIGYWKLAGKRRRLLWHLDLLHAAAEAEGDRPLVELVELAEELWIHGFAGEAVAALKTKRWELRQEAAQQRRRA